MATVKGKFLHPDEADKLTNMLLVERDSVFSSNETMLPCSHGEFSANCSVEKQRENLPIYKWRRHICYVVQSYRVSIIFGETGSGKSTQLPQYIYESGWLTPQKGMVITQPRRMAAVSLAYRVAEEKNFRVGKEVGYSIRFEHVANDESTLIKYVTDGILLREIMDDPLLSKYCIVMLDEVHERSVNTDILFGVLKKILRKRPDDLHLIVSSATLEAERIKNFFSDLPVFAVDRTDKTDETCCIMSVEGRQYPVDLHYLLDPAPDYIQAAIDTIVKINELENRSSGHILVFMPGQESVDRVVEGLLEIDRAKQTESHTKHKMRVLPLHANLSLSDQMKVFEKTHSRNVRKVVVSTNVAETSLTIPDITYVVDCGFVRLPVFLYQYGLESLLTVPISKASANQRAGRAGRVRAGKVYRLYTEETYKGLAEHTTPEFSRCDLSHVILRLKSLGVDNFLKFSFLTFPPQANMTRSVELLYALGAIDKNGRLTSLLGQRMAALPLHPMASLMIFSAVRYGCTKECIALAALLQIRNVFVIPASSKREGEKHRRNFGCIQGDHLSMLNAYFSYRRKVNRLSPAALKNWCSVHWLNQRGLQRAAQLHQQIKNYVVKKYLIPYTSCQRLDEPIIKSMICGFFTQVAYLEPGGRYYLTVRGDHELHIHPNSILYAEKMPKWVLFTSTVLGIKHYMEALTVIEKEDLYTLVPHYYRYGTEQERLLERDH